MRLRLVVARVGEMDNARWWNTSGQLGRLGGLTLRRGFPRTHGFAQARSVFAVAAHRCAEVFDPPRSVTLWKLPAAIEDAFESRWMQWLEAAESWQPFFEQLANIQGTDLMAVFEGLGLAHADTAASVHSLKRSPAAPALQIPAAEGLTDALVTRLAFGFSKGEPGALVVPYAPVGQ